MQKIAPKSEIRKKKIALIFVNIIILLLLSSISAFNPLNENPSIVQDKYEPKAPPITSGVTHIWNSSISTSTRDIEISQDGNYIVVGAANSKVYLFHKSNSTPMWTYNTSGAILSVDISSNGNYLVAGSEDGNLYLFNKSSSTPMRTYSIGAWVSGVVITPDGLYIGASSHNGYFYKFNKSSSTPMYFKNMFDDGMCVDISDDGRCVVAGTTKRIYYFHTLPQGVSNSPWIGAVVDDIAMSSDGKYYVAGAKDDLVRFFDSATGSVQWTYDTGGDVETVSISADGKYFVTNGGTPDRMFVFHQSSSSPLWNFTTGSTINSVAISDNGNYIVMGDAGNTVYLFSRTNSSPIWNFTPPSGFSIDGVAISSDGEYVTFGGGNNQIFLYNHLSKFNLTTEITILTPENITYTEPMTGYYPATYGFENDDVGAFPNEWEDYTDYWCLVDVRDSEDEHKNILRIYDPDLTYKAVLNNKFENQTTGTVEWWFKKTSGDTVCYFNFYGGNAYDITNMAIDFGIDAGNNGAFAVRDDGSWIFNYSHSDNVWCHLKVEFDCTNHNFSVYRNGIPVFENVTFWRKMDTINLMSIGTNTFGNGTFYTDAVGYSWDPNYNIGDNLNEGLLLSYDTNNDFNWTGYSLDEQANKTILGNNAILMPEDGLHSIQVFGNDSLGTMYESDVRYFIVGLSDPDISSEILSDIPGYNIITIIGIAIIITTLMVFKKRFSKYS